MACRLASPEANCNFRKNDCLIVLEENCWPDLAMMYCLISPGWPVPASVNPGVRSNISSVCVCVLSRYLQLEGQTTLTANTASFGGSDIPSMSKADTTIR